MSEPSAPVVCLVVCGAPPAAQVHELVALLRADGWDVIVVPTAAAMAWVDEAALVELTGRSVHLTGRAPDEQKTTPPLTAVAVVPATFNTVNKWAAGINDSPALGILNEALGQRLPIVAMPVVKGVLAAHPAFPRSVETLRSAGVTVIDPDTSAPGQWVPVVDALRAARP